MAAARALRRRNGLDGEPLSDSALAALAGVDAAALGRTSGADRAPLAFALDDANPGSRVVLRSSWPTGRRFELARLLGDRILSPAGRLFPAADTLTYRQKQQRAFSAEFLCPIEALDEMMAGDTSEDRQQDAAEHFMVSELLVRTQLVNNGRIDREIVSDAG